MTAEPQKEHHWLQKLAGEWISDPVKPDQPGNWTERVRPLGGTWIVAEAHGEMPGGGPAATLLTLGYDPQRGRFVGTWIGSMMTHLWVYDGELDEARNKLTLESDGPAMDGSGKMTKYRDVITLLSDNERVLTAYVLGDDGNWREIMKAGYRRKT